jgi:hypothetical protein
MLTSTLFAFVGAAASVLAAPLEARTGSPGNYFTPSAIYNYDVGTGAIQCTSTGLISKSTSNNGHDITTLVTFTYPAAAENHKCQFFFYLDSTASLSGSKKIDVFTSLAPAPGCTTGWGPGNQRNVNIGRISAELNNYATWDATYGAYLTAPSDCKAPGTQEGFELVGVYDNDYVSWNPTVAGARIVYY